MAIFNHNQRPNHKLEFRPSDTRKELVDSTKKASGISSDILLFTVQITKSRSETGNEYRKFNMACRISSV